MANVGSATVTRKQVNIDVFGASKAEIVTVAWTADGTGAFQWDIPLAGFTHKINVITASPNPTASYTLQLLDPFSSTIDAWAGTVGTLSATGQTAPIAIKYPSTSLEILLSGTYTLKVASNSVAGAKGTVEIWMISRNSMN